MVTLLIVSDVLLLVAIFGGYLARYVDPTTFWLLQPVGTLFPFVVMALLVVGSLMIMWSQHPTVLIAHGIALVLIGIRMAPGLTGAWAQDATFDNALVVVSANAPSIEMDLAPLASTYEPDIVAVQEAVVVHDSVRDVYGASRQIFGLLSSPGGYQVSRALGHARTNNPVVSTLRFGATTMLPEGNGDRDRFGLRTELIWEDQPIAVYNVHLRSFRRPGPEAGVIESLHRLRDDYRERAAQARYLQERLQDESLPFIVCGDFNSTPHNWSYYHVARALQDAYRVRGRGWGGTYHAGSPLLRIDFILASSDWEILRAETASYAGADHRLVVAHLELMER